MIARELNKWFTDRMIDPLSVTLHSQSLCDTEDPPELLIDIDEAFEFQWRRLTAAAEQPTMASDS